MHIGKRGRSHGRQQQERDCENHQARPPHSVHLLPRQAVPAAVWFSSDTAPSIDWFNSVQQHPSGISTPSVSCLARRSSRNQEGVGRKRNYINPSQKQEALTKDQPLSGQGSMAQITLYSGCRFPAAKRSMRKGSTSTVWARPSTISSAMRRPAAGPCMNPCPENPAI